MDWNIDGARGSELKIKTIQFQLDGIWWSIHYEENYRNTISGVCGRYPTPSVFPNES